MPELSNEIILNILQTVCPFACTLGTVLTVAEVVYKWFIRVAFGRSINSQF